MKMSKSLDEITRRTGVQSLVESDRHNGRPEAVRTLWKCGQGSSKRHLAFAV